MQDSKFELVRQMSKETNKLKTDLKTKTRQRTKTKIKANLLRSFNENSNPRFSHFAFDAVPMSYRELIGELGCYKAPMS